MDCRNLSGLTLVELLIALAVGSILMLVAVPAFTGMLRTSQLNSQTHLFISAVNYARSIAMERRQEVFICARNGNICQNSHQWEVGWIVFVDENGNGNVEESELIRVFDELGAGYTLEPNLPVSHLLFLPNGDVRRGSRALPMMTFRMCSPDAFDGNLAERSREIVINATGRMRLQFGREITGAC